VLFSEANSPFGETFLRLIHHHPLAELVAVVSREPGTICPDYPADAVDVPGVARSLCIPSLMPRIPGEAAAELRELKADYFIVANYQRVIPESIMQIPHRFCVNFHVGPLPRYAGLIPWHWMRVNRETRGGVAAIRLGNRLDAGDIVDEWPVPLPADSSEDEIRLLHFNAAYLLLDRVLEKLPLLEPGDLRPQDLSRRTYYNRSGPVMEEFGQEVVNSI
jgi:methionyl-tRNA formyltransferase